MPLKDFFRFNKGTKSSFNPKARSTSQVPTDKEEPRPIRDDSSPAAKTEQREAERETEDKKLVKDEVPVRDRLIKDTPKAKEGADETEPRTDTRADQTASNIYNILWRQEASYRLIPVQNPRSNFFAPNAMALFRLLDAAEQRVNFSKHIQTHEPHYMPYAVKVYYAIMFYIQIIRARRDSGTATGFENSLLKRFNAKYETASLPCAEIVYAYFNTVAATELSDVKYDWIAPQVASELYLRPHATNSFAETAPREGALYLQPHVPAMMAILRELIQELDLDQKIEGGIYTPVDLTPANHDVHAFGVDFHDNAQGHDDFKSIFAACGVSSTCEFGNQNFALAQAHAQRTDFAMDFNHGVTAAVRNGRLAALTDQRVFNSLDAYLSMEKTSNLKWFGYLRDQAIIHARFFDQIYSFDDVQTTCGLETTILCRLRNDGAIRFIDNKRLGIQNHAVTWYPDVMRNLNGGFATTRSGIRRNEELQALAFGTNATLPINHTAGTPTDDTHPPLGHALRTGDYWTNKEWIQNVYWEDTPIGKPMYMNYNSAVLRCFREKPHGTGVVDNMFDA